MKKLKILMAVVLTCLLSFGFGQSALAAFSEEELDELYYQAQVILFYVTDDSFLLTAGLPQEELELIGQTPLESMDPAAVSELKSRALARIESSKAEAVANVENIFGNYMGIYLNGNVIIDAMKSFGEISDRVGVPNMLAEPVENDFFEIKDKSIKQDSNGVTISYLIAAAKSDIVVTAEFGADATMSSITIIPGSKLSGGVAGGISDGLMKLAVLAVIVAILAILAYVSYAKKKAANEIGADGHLATVKTNAISKTNTAPGANTELVAVIAAAIAASQGRTSTEGIIIRSIRRR